MRNLVTGMVFGIVVGSIIGTIASDDIYDMKNMLAKKGKKIMKKCKLL